MGRAAIQAHRLREDGATVRTFCLRFEGIETGSAGAAFPEVSDWRGHVARGADVSEPTR